MSKEDWRPPEVIDWQLTYACQLRCSHCYTESGRRPSKRLPREAMFRIADKLSVLGVRSINFCGGEPLLIPEIFDLAARMRTQNPSLELHLLTNGYGVSQKQLKRAHETFTHLHVSLDGATASVHDGIRGRKGAFEAATRVLSDLDAQFSEVELSRRQSCFGVEVTLIRSNYDQLVDFCDLAARWKHISFIAFGVAIPSGLASSARFADQELLNESEIEMLRAPATRSELEARLPSGLQLSINDNIYLRFAPHDVQAGNAATTAMEVEPDGGVRGALAYEGIVGNLLTEELPVLWLRVGNRMNHSVVRNALREVRTMKEWARAAREIDTYFCQDSDKDRVQRHSDGE